MVSCCQVRALRALAVTLGLTAFRTLQTQTQLHLAWVRKPMARREVFTGMYKEGALGYETTADMLTQAGGS